MIKVNTAKLIQSVFLAGLMAAVSGCASWLPDHDKNLVQEEVKDDITSIIDGNISGQTGIDTFLESEVWLKGSFVEAVPQKPSIYTRPVNLSESRKTLPQIANRITSLTGVSIVLDSDIKAEPTGDSDSGFSVSTDATGESIPLFPPSTPAAQSSDPTEDPYSNHITFKFAGDFEGVMDMVASRFGIQWKYDHSRNQATFYRLQTKSFQVFFPGGSQTTVGVGSSTSTDAVVNQNVSYSHNGGSWEDVENSVKSFLSPYGKVKVMPSAGLLIVTDTPPVVKGITDYVKTLNGALSRQVFLDVKVMSVTMQGSNEFSATWESIVKSINGGEIDLGFAGIPAVTNPGNQLNIISNGSTGANLALKALATKARVSEVTSATVTTATNQPAPIKVVQDVGYIESVSENTEESTGDKLREITPGKVIVGFDMTLLPRVMDMQNLLLQVSLEMSSLIELKSFEDTLVQTPLTDRKVTTQRAFLKSGETLVLSGFTSDRNASKIQGTGDEDFWALGGGRARDDTQRTIVVMITPYVTSAGI